MLTLRVARVVLRCLTYVPGSDEARGKRVLRGVQAGARTSQRDSHG